jgi:hypothetical protein
VELHLADVLGAVWAGDGDIEETVSYAGEHGIREAVLEADYEDVGKASGEEGLEKGGEVFLRIDNHGAARNVAAEGMVVFVVIGDLAVAALGGLRGASLKVV